MNKDKDGCWISETGAVHYVHCFTTDNLISSWGYLPHEMTYEQAKEKLLEEIKKRGQTVVLKCNRYTLGTLKT